MFSLNKRNIRVAIFPLCNFNCIYCDGEQRYGKPGRPGAMEDFRRKPLGDGNINIDMILEIIKALHLAGFEGMTLTGGEPFLNPEWDVIVERSKGIGMKRVGITTNGLLLNTYIQKNKHLPTGLDLVTISLDTIDPKRFKEITGNDKLGEIIRGLKAAKKANPKLIIRANKIVMRSDTKSFLDYIKFCKKSGFIDEINLLNLILKDKKNVEFFEKEFMSTEEILNFFSKQKRYNFSMDDKYEFIARLPSGLKIILKDTNLTLRNRQCLGCPIYCQEGFYTVRVATDGTINTCMDYRVKLPFIDGPAEFNKGTLLKKVKGLVKDFESVRLQKTLRKFFEINNI